MLRWLRKFVIQRLGKKAAKREFGISYEEIMRIGSSDAICTKVLAKIDGDPELLKFIGSVGIREAVLPFGQTTIRIAAINSLMLARRDLLAEPDAPDARRRLQHARRAFHYSFLVFTEQEFAAETERQARGVLMMLSGSPRPVSLYTERAKLADDALRNWMIADIAEHEFIL